MKIKKIILLIIVITASFNLISCGLSKDKMINSRLNESSKIRDKGSK